MVVKPFVGLEVVIPRNFPRKQIPRILQQHEGWIIKQLDKHRHTFQTCALPETIQLSLTGEHIALAYTRLSDNGAKPSWRFEQGVLMISHHQHQDAIQQLRHWLRAKARQHLPAMLSEIAQQYDFRFTKTSIRSQKSRWGSCSSKGTISLNDQLLFMPQASVRYLMIHELCHTRHMNHSASFWQLVESCCTDYRQHEMNLNKPSQWVPEWFTQSLHQG